MTTSSTGSASSGVLQSLGIGSGLDIQTLVTQLTTAEMSADTARVTREQTSVTTQVSALASLKSALSTFQSTISSLNSASSFDARNAASGDETVFTAIGVSSAAVGNYDVTVKQLAQSNQLVSKVITGGASQVIGTGTLTLGLGTSSVNVTIDSTNNTLSGIRNAINAASGNSGISATLVYGTTGAQLLLSSTKTGAANTISVNTTGGDGGLSQLVYNGTTTNYTVKQAGKDSIVSIAGVDHQSSSNFVGDAIDGVTLTLKKEQPDTPVTLTISNDSAHVESLLQSFVTAYNTMVSSLAPLGSYDASTKVAGPMLGDALLTGIQSQISRILTSNVSSVTGAYSSLASLGVTRNVDGTMTLDTSKLESALNTNFKSVTDVLSAQDGVINNLNSFLSSALASGSSIDARNTSLTDQQKSISDEQDSITARSAVIQQRYLTKFNAMDTLLSQLQNTSTFLTQQFNALNKPAS